MLQAYPFPHCVIDHVFPETLIDEINRMWPSKLPGKEKGHGTHHFSVGPHNILFSDAELTFWTQFFKNEYLSLLQAQAEIYLPYICARLGRVPEKLYVHPLRLEAAEFGNEHEIHHHYAHNPQWLFTMLIYVDNEDVCKNGTRVFKVRGDEVIGSRKIYRPHPERYFEEVKHVEFQCNRLFSFLEGPLSLHGVSKAAQPERLPRHGRRLL